MFTGERHERSCSAEPSDEWWSWKRGLNKEWPIVKILFFGIQCRGELSNGECFSNTTAYLAFMTTYNRKVEDCFCWLLVEWGVIVDSGFSAWLKMLSNAFVEGRRCTADVKLSANRTSSSINDIRGVTYRRILNRTWRTVYCTVGNVCSYLVIEILSVLVVSQVECREKISLRVSSIAR